MKIISMRFLQNYLLEEARMTKKQDIIWAFRKEYEELS